MAENSEDDSDFKDVTKLNYTKILSGLTKIGYAEGVNAGRDLIFQNGFDEGYRDGLRVGFEITKYKTLANELSCNTCTTNDANLNTEIRLFQSNDLANAKSELQFQMNNHHLDLDDKSVNTISKIQSTFTDNVVQTLSTKYPCMTKLLV